MHSQSFTTPPHLKHLFPLALRNLAKAVLHDEGTECKRYELVYENKKGIRMKLSESKKVCNCEKVYKSEKLCECKKV